MKLTKGRLSKLYQKNNQTRRRFKNSKKKQYRYKNTFRKKRSFDLNRKTLKKVGGADSKVPVINTNVDGKNGEGKYKDKETNANGDETINADVDNTNGKNAIGDVKYENYEKNNADVDETNGKNANGIETINENVINKELSKNAIDEGKYKERNANGDEIIANGDEIIANGDVKYENKDKEINANGDEIIANDEKDTSNKGRNEEEKNDTTENVKDKEKPTAQVDPKITEIMEFIKGFYDKKNEDTATFIQKLSNMATDITNQPQNPFAAINDQAELMSTLTTQQSDKNK